MSIEQVADQLLGCTEESRPERVLRGVVSEESDGNAAREAMPESALTKLEMARAVVGSVLKRSKDDPNGHDFARYPR